MYIQFQENNGITAASNRLIWVMNITIPWMLLLISKVFVMQVGVVRSGTWCV